MPKRGQRFYAYITGKSYGIVTTWGECKARVHGVSGAKFNGFSTRMEAEEWVHKMLGPKKRPDDSTCLRKLFANAIFFDSGTGGGRGTEVRISNRRGRPYRFNRVPEGRMLKSGNVLLKNRTNNYGELFGCYLALRLALRKGKTCVCGDSELVVKWWSTGHVTKKKAARDPDLVVLAQKVKRLRDQFEAQGGKVLWIPGYLNPADPGFRRRKKISTDKSTDRAFAF